MQRVLYTIGEILPTGPIFFGDSPTLPFETYRWTEALLGPTPNSDLIFCDTCRTDIPPSFFLSSSYNFVAALWASLNSSFFESSSTRWSCFCREFSLRILGCLGRDAPFVVDVVADDAVSWLVSGDTSVDAGCGVCKNTSNTGLPLLELPSRRR